MVQAEQAGSTDAIPYKTAGLGVEEETGWRPRTIKRLTSIQPMVGTADAENVLFLARGADFIGTPKDINEAERVAWIPLDSIQDRMAQGEIIGAASQVGLLHVLAFYRD